MLNSYTLYSPPTSSTNNLRRNSLNSTIPLTKYRRNSLSQSTFEDFNEDIFSSSTSNPIQPPKLNETNSNFDTNLSFLDGLDNINLPDLSTPSSSIVSSPQSTVQCVRIIRRNDTAPIQTNSNPRRVVRVIRVSNTIRTPEQTTPSSSNVYIVRKNDITPTVQINPAVKHVLNKPINIDENNQINKFYGSTISIFGIEFTVVSNENNQNVDNKCASLVQNFNETNNKNNLQTTNKVIGFLFVSV